MFHHDTSYVDSYRNSFFVRVEFSHSRKSCCIAYLMYGHYRHISSSKCCQRASNAGASQRALSPFTTACKPRLYRLTNFHALFQLFYSSTVCLHSTSHFGIFRAVEQCTTRWLKERCNIFNIRFVIQNPISVVGIAKMRSDLRTILYNAR